MNIHVFYIALILLFNNLVYAQKSDSGFTISTLKLNFINPGIDYEFPVFDNTTLSLNAGFGYDGSYPELSLTFGSGGLYLIAPFIDVQYRGYYNFHRRARKGKNTDNNSGNFVATRLLIRGRTWSSNFARSTNTDYAVGIRWGFQRAYNRVHLLYSMGPIFYTDGQGRNGIFPLTIELNLGYRLSK